MYRKRDDLNLRICGSLKQIMQRLLSQAGMSLVMLIFYIRSTTVQLSWKNGGWCG